MRKGEGGRERERERERGREGEVKRGSKKGSKIWREKIDMKYS